MRRHLLLGVAVALGSALGSSAQVSENLLRNPSFEEGLGDNGLPVEWSLYAGNGQNQAIRLVKPGDQSQQAAMLDDPDPTAEIGMVQQNPAPGGLVYEAGV
ncbi:MAG: hypothetical protein FJX74_23265, partial [Armatimonadetes bacterium]|nr:hypothetical protein [Armatimonadota bacterium]